MQLVDINMIANGEVATPLQRLLQEIDVIMTAGAASLLTNYEPRKTLDRFLFKTGVNKDYVAREVHQKILANISPDLQFEISVNAEFLKGLKDKDALLVNIIVDAENAHEELSYTIS